MSKKLNHKARLYLLFILQDWSSPDANVFGGLGASLADGDTIAEVFKACSEFASANMNRRGWKRFRAREFHDGHSKNCCQTSNYVAPEAKEFVDDYLSTLEKDAKKEKFYEMSSKAETPLNSMMAVWDPIEENGPDFLDEIIQEATEVNPKLLQEAVKQADVSHDPFWVVDYNDPKGHETNAKHYQDFLDEIMQEATETNPEFPKLLQEAENRRSTERLRKFESDTWEHDDEIIIDCLLEQQKKLG